MRIAVIGALLAAAQVVDAGVVYRVVASSESVTITQPDPTKATPAPGFGTRRTGGTKTGVTADVSIEGSNIRIDNFEILMDGKSRTGNVPHEVFISRDGGLTFDHYDTDTRQRRRWPLEVSLSATGMATRAFASVFSIRTQEVDLRSKKASSGSRVQGFETTTNQVDSAFRVRGDDRVRRPDMAVRLRIRAWTTAKLPVRIQPSLHGWNFGIPAIDDAIRDRAPIDGFPLKVTSDVSMTTGRQLQTIISTFEVVDLRVEQIPDATFEAPFR